MKIKNRTVIKIHVAFKVDMGRWSWTLTLEIKHYIMGKVARKTLAENNNHLSISHKKIEKFWKKWDNQINLLLDNNPSSFIWAWDW